MLCKVFRKSVDALLSGVVLLMFLEMFLSEVSSSAPLEHSVLFSLTPEASVVPSVIPALCLSGILFVRITVEENNEAVAAGPKRVLEVAGDAVADAGAKVVAVLGVTVLVGVLACIEESTDFLTWKDSFPLLMLGGTVTSLGWFLDLDSVL